MALRLTSNRPLTGSGHGETPDVPAYSLASPLRLLTLKQVSAETGLPLSTLYRMADERAIPVTRISVGGARGRIYVRAMDLDGFLAQHTTPAVLPAARFDVPKGRRMLS